MSRRFPVPFPPVPLRALLASALVTLACAATARAQVQMNCVPVALPSAYPTDWKSTHSLCVLTMTNNLSEPVRCDLRVQMDQSGGSSAGVEPRVFAPGQTVLLTQNVFDWNRLRFSGAVKNAIDRTGHLPATPVRVQLVCTNMVGAQSGLSIPDTQIEITIVPSVPSPPTLLTPADASAVGSPTPIFGWTPVRLTSGAQVTYRFLLVRVLPGQSPARALESNTPVLEAFVGQPSLPYPSAAPRFEDGALYAWRVQSLFDLAAPSGVGSPIPGARFAAAIPPAPAPGTTRFTAVGLNDGKSPVHTFVWQRPDAPTAVARIASATDVAGSGATSALIGNDDGAASAPPPARLWRPLAASRITTALDSLAIASNASPGDWWGPKAGTRGGAFESQVTTGTGETAPESPAPSGGEPLAPPAEPQRYAPIDAVPDVEPGAGVATRWFHLTGTTVTAGEIYDRSGAGPRSRPDQSGQLALGVRVGLFGDRVEVPVQALVSGDEVSFRQSIDHFSLRPQWRWGGVQAGQVRPAYSRYSLADASLFGGGADIVREHWYAGGVVGRMQESVKRDTVLGIEPQFRRNVFAGRAGIGSPVGNAVELVVMRALDDPGSLSDPDSLALVAPAANTVFEARARHTLLDTLTTIQLDAALTQFERNRDADVPAIDGHAFGAKLERRTSLGEIAASVDYTDGGFRSFGNSQLASDHAEGQLRARRVLAGGRFRLGGSVGLRRDDLSGTLGGSTRRRSLGLQAGWQPNAILGADLDVSALASRSPRTEFRDELKDLTASFTLAPHANWYWSGSPQSVNAMVSVQSTQFPDAAGAAFAASRVTTLVGGWQGGVSRTLSVSVSGNLVRSKVAGQITELGALGPGLSLSLFGGRAQTTLLLQVTQTKVEGLGTDRELTPNVDARYRVTDRQSLVFRAGWRRYRTGADASGDFDEQLATLQYSATL